jgi:hypothetical protein
MVDLLLGTGVLITGIEEQAEGWMKVYVGPRWKNVYVVCADPDDRARVKRAWGSSMHLTMPKPAPEALFDDEHPYVVSDE